MVLQTGDTETEGGVNNRLMAVGRMYYDSWWIQVVTMGAWLMVSLVLENHFPHPSWWLVALSLVAALATGFLMARVMWWWHGCCEARRWRKILAMRVPLTETFWQKTRGGSDAE